MTTKIKILIVALIIGLLGIGIYFAFFNKPVPYDVQVSVEDNDNKEVTEAKENKEKAEVKEKTLEEREREIESKKPRSKIAIDLLKDTSNATVDDTLATLPDAPLHYKVEGINFKLKENPENVENFTKELAEEDIKRLQSYGYNWHTGYVDEVQPRIKYGEYYKKYSEDTKWAIENLHPQRLNVFKNAIVGWVTDPNLVYDPANTTYGISGVLQLSYLRENNMFDLEPYKLYERDVEFRYANTTEGLFLRQIIYLGDWKEVKSWKSPYE